MVNKTSARNNVAASIVGKTLTITIDLDAESYVSKSGKSRVIATTSGALTLDNGMKLNMTLYKAL